MLGWWVSGWQAPQQADLMPWVIGGLIGMVVVLAGFLVNRQRHHASRAGSEPEGEAAPPFPFQFDPFTHGSSQEQRTAFRRRGNPVPVLVSDAGATAPPARGLVLDRSTGGLCLEVDEPAEVGHVLSIRAANAVGLLPWVQVKVKNCRAYGNRWQLGCQFVQAPPSPVLWSFG